MTARAWIVTKSPKKAKEMGLFANAAHVSDSELYEVLFRPGFSTSESVTDLSGRGVGLDVCGGRSRRCTARCRSPARKGGDNYYDPASTGMYSSAPLQALQVEMPLG